MPAPDASDPDAGLPEPDAAASPPRPSRRWAALLSALLGALGAAGAALLVLAPAAVVVHPEAYVSPAGDEALIDARNSPTFVRDPLDADRLVVVARQDRPRFAAAAYWSADGGQSWTETSLPLPDGADRPFAPDAAFGPDGTLYVSYVNLAGAGNVPERLWVARSEDGGRTFAEPVQVAGDLAFQSRLAVGPDGTVHVTWLQATGVGTLRLTGPARVVAARSEDGGHSFEPSVRVSDPERERVGAATPVVAPNGDLLVLYQDFRDNARDFRNLEGPPWPNPSALVLTRSTDGGAAFGGGIEVDAEVLGTRRFLVFLPEFPALAVGPDGRVYVAWADGRNGDLDVWLRRSDDGRSWTEPQRVNDNASRDGSSQYLPQVAVAPDGRVDVVYLDRRGDREDRRTGVSVAWSTDRGRSFRSVPVASQRFDARLAPVPGGPLAPHLEPDHGSRLGLVSSDDGAVVAWADTRLASEDTRRQDVVSARVQLPDFRARRLGWWGVFLALAGAASLLSLYRRRVPEPSADG